MAARSRCPLFAEAAWPSSASEGMWLIIMLQTLYNHLPAVSSADMLSELVSRALILQVKSCNAFCLHHSASEGIAKQHRNRQKRISSGVLGLEVLADQLVIFRKEAPCKP